MIDLLRKFFEGFLNILFPKCCICCNKEGDFLCSDCYSQIKIKENPISKIDFKNGNYLSKLFIPCSYHKNPILQQAVHKMKYKYFKDISESLAPLIASAIKKQNLSPNTVLIPIPLHKKRYKFRGFNQAELLANHISKFLNFPVTNLLIRTKETPSQATLTREQRLTNLNGVFKLIEQNSVPRYTPLLLIDDICTTLSTMQEAAKTLQNNGYTLIFGAALARG